MLRTTNPYHFVVKESFKSKMRPVCDWQWRGKKKIARNGKGKKRNGDTSRIRTDASEENRFLIYRLRPLGHSVLNHQPRPP